MLLIAVVAISITAVVMAFAGFGTIYYMKVRGCGLVPLLAAATVRSVMSEKTTQNLYLKLYVSKISQKFGGARSPQPFSIVIPNPNLVSPQM